jgi:hypothetical protein
MRSSPASLILRHNIFHVVLEKGEVGLLANYLMVHIRSECLVQTLMETRDLLFNTLGTLVGILYFSAVYCTVLYCAVLCCAVLCCAVLCCAVLCCAVLKCYFHVIFSLKTPHSQGETSLIDVN